LRYATWVAQFSADPSLLGKSFTLNGVPRTQLVGVPDTGRIRGPSCRATGVSPPRRSSRSDERGNKRVCKYSGVLNYDWSKTGGRS
jgi:hypothetical protein